MIQSTIALEMVSHHFTSHGLCDLRSAALFTLAALSRLYMTSLITDYFCAALSSTCTPQEMPNVILLAKLCEISPEPIGLAAFKVETHD